MRRLLIITVVLLFSLCRALCGQNPTPGPVDYRLVDSCDYRDDNAAAAVWRSHNGSTRPEAGNAVGRRVLRVPCRFKATKAPCASVERKVKLDLTRCQGLQFQFLCTDPSSISKFNFYLRSGRGWYAATFATDNASGWNTVIIDKDAMQKEGTPGAWGEIDTIRITAWKTGDTDTSFSIADLGLWGEDAQILVVRGDWYVKQCPGEAASVAARMVNVSQNLRAIGAGYHVCADLELTGTRLRGKKLVVLPQNSELPAQAVTALSAFLRSGGKLVSFYVLPPELREVAGISQGGPVRQTYTGYFAAMHSVGKAVRGMPARVCQRSWSVYQTRPVEGRSTVAAYWYTDRDVNTGEPAIVVSDNCIHMTHVMLSDDPAGKKALMLAITGHFVPEAWKLAARTAIAQIDTFGPYREKGELERIVGVRAKSDSALQGVLDRADRLRDQAGGQFGLGWFTESFQTAEEARKLMIRAHCMVQSPIDGERRMVWCHDPFGITGMNWDRSISILEDNGFTDIVVNMCWAGNANYESKVLPVSPEAVARGDQVKQCLDACRRHGIRLHLWRVCWNMGWTAPKEFVTRMKREGRTQVVYDGTAKDNWLCPSHPDNRKLEIAALVEMAKNYAVDGIHLDYIRYPGSTCCFCQGCRERFERGTGMKVKKWPADVKTDPGLAKKWLEFRRKNITAVVAGASAGAREARPGISVSAAVYSDWPADRDDIGQDWKLWCDAGYLDFVCPMDYTANNRDFQATVGKQLVWAGRARCYPGIGLSLWPASEQMVRLVDQVNITRRAETGGFIIFNYNRSEAEEILPLCGSGLTRKTPRK